MINKTRAIARQYGAKVVAGSVGALAFVSAHAQSATTIDSLFDAVDLSGVSAKVLASAAIICTLALIYKGPTLVKRIIAKI